MCRRASIDRNTSGANVDAQCREDQPERKTELLARPEEDFMVNVIEALDHAEGPSHAGGP